ncbi:hypothetical protein ABVT39_023794 [Epinephelus coioides]
MAEPWRTPHPYQQNQDGQPMFLYQQQVPFALGHPQPPYPPPSYAPPLPGSSHQTVSCPTPTCASSEDALVERRGCSPRLAQLRFMLAPPEVPSHIGTPQRSSSPVASTSTVGGQGQTGPGQGVNWSSINPGPQSASQYLTQMQTSLGARKSTTAQAPTPEENFQHNSRADMLSSHTPDSSSSSEKDNDPQSCGYSPTTPEPVEPQTTTHIRTPEDGHLPVQGLQRDIRTLLEVQYGVYPESVTSGNCLMESQSAQYIVI